MLSKSGDPLVKAITLRIFTPQNKRVTTRTIRAPHGQGISAEGIEAELRVMADRIERQWPTEEYGLVPTGPTSFNFVWRKTKEPEAAA